MIEDPIEAFRRLTPEEQIQEGEDSLLSHVLEKAIQAHAKYPLLGMDQMDAFLADPDCLRYPTRYVYEFGSEMAPHQFAQPEEDFRLPGGQGKVVYLRPVLRQRPDFAALAVAYMVPPINYGDIASDAHCLVYAAALLGLTEDECYERLCAVADFCGSEIKYAGAADSPTLDCASGSCACAAPS